MKKIMNSVKVRYALLAMVVIASIGIGFSQMSQVAHSDNCAGTAPTTPTFNYWPLSYSGASCTDLPLIDAKNQSSSDARDSRYANSSAEHDAGISAAAGDSVRVLMYFHNGASDQIDRAGTTAHNVTVSSAFDTGTGTTHTASGSISASNAGTVTSAQKGGDIKINTASPTTLQYIPHSAFLCVRYDAAVERGADLNDTCGFDSMTNKPMILIPISDSINNGSFNLGDLKACFPYAGFLAYSVKVVQAAVTPPSPTNTTLSLTKNVRNVTQGRGTFIKTETASIGDIVEYQINVTNTGSNTAAAVNLTDVFPANGLSYTSGTNITNGQPLSLGDLAPGQTRTVLFQARANANGSYTNTATAQGSNTNSATDSATVNVNTIVIQSPCVVNSFTLSPTSVTSGQTTTLSWSVSNATSVSIDGTTVAASGSASSAPITANRTFTLSATGLGGNCSATANVTLNTVVAHPAITISKDVRDITQNTGFATNLNVFNGDTVEYRLIITNTGDTTLTNVTVNEDLPSGLNFQASTLASTMGVPNSLSNIRVSSLGVGQSFTVTFRATVNQTSGQIVNHASVTSDQASAGPVSATLNISPATVCTFTVTKLVKNLTQNSNGSFSSSVSANPGDRIAYQIQVTPNARNATNITIADPVPANFTYAFGSARLNGSATSDTFINSQQNIGSANVGQTTTFTFEGNVASNLSAGSYTITNTANVSADNMGTCSSSASVFVNVAGTNPNFQIGISKLVRNVTSNTSYQKSVNATVGNTVNFQITVTNQGTGVLNNVSVNDILPNGLSLVSGTVRVDGSSSFDSLVNNSLSLGTLNVNQSRTLNFDATVNSAASGTLINTARASSSNTGTVQDTATVFVGQVAGGFVNIVQSKRANNDTKNIDATLTPASKEDYITYTLTTANTGNTPATNYVVSDDLTNVLSLSGMVDLNGATMNGNVISWPAETIQPGQSSIHTFRVRVNYNLPARSGLQMVNTYGNTVTVQIRQGAVLGAVLVAPTTGANAMAVGIGFAALLTAAFWVIKRKQLIPSIKFR